MRVISKILFIFIVLLGAHNSFIPSVFAADSELLDQIETQINADSSAQSIKNLQNLFTQLGLYTGEIDWIYSSIEPDIINYQIQSGIINSAEDWGAGYFGKKTIAALQDDFSEEFSETATQTIAKQELEEGDRGFVVTAYYSPLPGQSKYVTGSYAWDIRLNGNGTHGASWVAVHPWFLAAPSNYDFGTKIYFEWLGVWIVEDRWGAIVNAWSRWNEYDRIDIWMWYGDEWRIRAITWWKRTVTGEILSDDAEVTIAFDNSPVNKYLGLTVDGENPDSENVKKLQELFTEIGKYNGAIDGEFTDIREILIDFQVKKSIISSSTSDEAWYFGPKTLAALREDYESSIDFEADTSVPEEVEIELIELSKTQKAKLDTIIDKINDYIIDKADGDDQREDELIDKLQSRILDLSDKQTKTIRKLQLEYIANNL